MQLHLNAHSVKKSDKCNKDICDWAVAQWELGLDFRVVKK